jgi:hypothetical protein
MADTVGNRPSFAPSLHSGASAGKANLLEVRMLMIKLKQLQKEEHLSAVEGHREDIERSRDIQNRPEVKLIIKVHVEINY